MRIQKRKPISPRGCCRKIALLVEANAPKLSAGWWNLEREKAVMSKDIFREIYRLALEGLKYPPKLREPLEPDTPHRVLLPEEK